MKQALKNGLICIGGGFIMVYISFLLESGYIFAFINRGLIIILISLLAINTTTSSIIMTKLKEIADKTSVSFSRTIKQLHLSIKEQVWLIAIGLFFLIINNSELIQNKIPALTFAIDTILVAIFLYAILILRDTANAIFVILGYEDNDSQ
jgi:hypothetical protein